MKPILHIQIPSKNMDRNTAELVRTMAKTLKERLLDNYEVIFSPVGADVKLRSEGNVINLSINPSTNIKKLLKNLDKIAKLKTIDNEMKQLKSRSPLMPILYDPFKDFETARKNSESFHKKFIPSMEYLEVCYDAYHSADPEKCLDDYWIPIINKVNQSGMSDDAVLDILKNRGIDPNLITLIKLNEEATKDTIRHGKTMVLSVDMKAEEDSINVTLTDKNPMDGC